MTAIDVDSLPIKQQLILDVLAARVRLGEPFWPFPTKLRKALDALQDAGLVTHESDVIEGQRRVRFTDEGKSAVLSPTYQPPRSQIHQVGALRTRAEALAHQVEVQSREMEQLARLCDAQADEIARLKAEAGK